MNKEGEKCRFVIKVPPLLLLLLLLLHLMNWNSTICWEIFHWIKISFYDLLFHVVTMWTPSRQRSKVIVIILTRSEGKKFCKVPQNQIIMFGLINRYGFTDHVIVVLLFIKYLERKILMLFVFLSHSIDSAPQETLDWPRPSHDVPRHHVHPRTVWHHLLHHDFNYRRNLGILDQKILHQIHVVTSLKRDTRPLSVTWWRSFPRWRHDGLSGMFRGGTRRVWVFNCYISKYYYN